MPLFYNNCLFIYKQYDHWRRFPHGSASHWPLLTLPCFPLPLINSRETGALDNEHSSTSCSPSCNQPSHPHNMKPLAGMRGGRLGNHWGPNYIGLDRILENVWWCNWWDNLVGAQSSMKFCRLFKWVQTSTHYWTDCQLILLHLQPHSRWVHTSFPHLCTPSTLQPHIYISSPLIMWLHRSAADSALSSLALAHSFLPLSRPPVYNSVTLSPSIIHGAVTVGIKGPRNIATATTQQKQPHWIMGNWVTSQEREGVGLGVQRREVCCHTRTRTHTHTW